jgi:hypothetical protein
MGDVATSNGWGWDRTKKYIKAGFAAGQYVEVL